MIEICYAVIVRDENSLRLGVCGTHLEPKTLHGKIMPHFHTFCASLLALYPAAASVETVSWKVGVDVEQAPVLLVGRRTEHVGMLSYSFSVQPVPAEVQA